MGPIELEESLYLFEPDEEERARLNNQHRVLIRLIENRILHAPIDPSAIATVADVGTGTGIWLDALATHLDAIPILTPAATDQVQRQYDGLDMTPANFPAAQSHPDNFHYDVYNILQPVPEERKGKYDLVHVRLLAAAFSKGQVDIAVDNLVQLLPKLTGDFAREGPGGWIQWEELDGDSWAGRVPSPHVREMSELGRKHMEAKEWELHLFPQSVPAAFLKAAKAHPSLQNVSEKIYNTVTHGYEIKDAINSTWLWSCTRSAKMILLASGKSNVEEEMQRLEQGARRDIERGGLFWDSDEHVLLAQRKWQINT
ncbi:hypothetical protein BDW59DRAFT_158618 [Aspergillus cavernicola]|uniref:S-adenosyl-L-methionine-dependent methyltransferase n=1 Tax=Aspergillus cavernicola TaxID=176166 RepID=A0ABR4IR98_9EURO